MATHIVTLGWDHPSRILPSLMTNGTPDHVLFVCSTRDAAGGHPRLGKAIGKYLQGKLAELNIESALMEIPPLEADTLVTRLMGWEADRPEIHLNITGGTKIMVVGAMMYAMMSARVTRIYYASAKQYGTTVAEDLSPEDIDELNPSDFISHGYGATYDVPRVGHLDLLRDRVAQAVLSQLTQRIFTSLGELAESAAEQAHVSENTVRDRIRDLHDKRIVEIIRDRREGKPTLTNTGKQLAGLAHLVAAQ